MVLVLLAGLLVVVWPDGGEGADSEQAGAPCTRPTRLRVAADPQVAALVATAAKSAACTRVTVTARRSADVASEVSRRTGQGLSAPLPDVWVPDSSLWLGVARKSDVGSRRIIGTPRSVVTSPGVIAMSRERAEALGWPTKQPGWAALAAGGAGTKVAMTDPRRDGAGLASLLALRPEEGATSAAAVSRSLAPLARSVRVPVLRDTAAVDAVAAGTVDALPASEQEVIAHNKAKPGTPVVAVYDPSAAAVLDFPIVVLDGDASGQLPPATSRAIGALRRAVLGDEAQQRFATAGYRVGEGRLAAQFGPEQGVLRRPATPESAASDDQVRALLQAWLGLGRRGRVLVVIDESGSMAGRLPGSRLTKSELAKRALAEAVTSIAPDSDMGLWSFTASRRTDYRVLVPLGPVDGPWRGGTRRAGLAAAVRGIEPEVGGGTGLYDTTLAAFRSASRDYAYGRLNAVLVITDGRNEDPGSIGLDRLLDTLRRDFDGVRPVRLITLAYGEGADLATLQRIADVTGGAAYRTATASDVGPIFATALSQL